MRHPLLLDKTFFLCKFFFGYGTLNFECDVNLSFLKTEDDEAEHINMGIKDKRDLSTNK
jgi:hypothetical protein